MVEPCMDLTEDYGVIVGHTLLDASSWSASVLMVNFNADKIVLPCFACVGSLVPVSAVSVALAEPVLPGWSVSGTLPDHLEDIVTGSQPSLGGGGGRSAAAQEPVSIGTRHVFPAPGVSPCDWTCHIGTSD